MLLMLQLPNGCFCSGTGPSISPKNWKELRSLTVGKNGSPKPWRIHYRFYDPTFSEPIEVSIKGMNDLKTLADRKGLTKKLLEQEIKLLADGYNPFYKKIIKPGMRLSSVETHTFLIPALESAIEHVTLEEKTKNDLRHIVRTCKKAVDKLGLQYLEIKDARRRHIKTILEQCRRLMPRFTDNTYNQYRGYLNILFNELLEMEVVDTNPIKDLSKKKGIIKQRREVLTDDQRVFVNDLLQRKYPEFHRFLHIFFHSGARITELMRIKGKDIDLKRQVFTTLIKKGKQKRVVERTIKNIALPLWEQAVNNCKPEEFVFSKGLKPGLLPIQSYQITKRWYRLIKNGKDEKGLSYGITSDFYALKHLNTSEVVESLGDKAAAKLNEHTSTAMVVKIYDVNREKRQHDQLREINNPFTKLSGDI